MAPLTASRNKPQTFQAPLTIVCMTQETVDVFRVHTRQQMSRVCCSIRAQGRGVLMQSPPLCGLAEPIAIRSSCRLRRWHLCSVSSGRWRPRAAPARRHQAPPPRPCTRAERVGDHHVQVREQPAPCNLKELAALEQQVFGGVYAVCSQGSDGAARSPTTGCSMSADSCTGRRTWVRCGAPSSAPWWPWTGWRHPTSWDCGPCPAPASPLCTERVHCQHMVSRC